MPSLEYFITNILFLTPLIAGPILGSRGPVKVKVKDAGDIEPIIVFVDRNNTGQWIYFLYTCVIGAFLLYSIYKNLNSSTKLRIASEGFKKFQEEGISEGGMTILNSPWRVLRFILLFFGTILDTIFFPKTKIIRNISILVFFSIFIGSWGHLSSIYSGESIKWLDSIFSILLIVMAFSLAMMYFSKGDLHKGDLHKLN